MLRLVRILRELLTRQSLAFFMCLASPACLAAGSGNVRSPCSNISLDDLYASYVVSEAHKYRGGLTPELSAEGRLGEVVVIERDGLHVRDVVVSNPSYELACYRLPTEGEVEVSRRSDFYGFGLNRSAIEVLHVYDESVDSRGPVINFEVVDGQLWELYDGWLYKMVLP